ncbi:peptide-methionine (R)-S-oxide reductase MsrB [Flavilitoribacter nigricans]|nr:peptide-methionine (R)-S-oxide reductase MsrB [Flavilitoribacter nigricans]
MKYWLSVCLCLFVFAACNRAQNTTSGEETTSSSSKIAMEDQQYAPPSEGDIEKIEKPASEWQAELSDLEFRVLRQAGTERAFTGDLWDNKADGIYTCRGCGLPLFDSATKFKSGTGWPSFYQPLKAKYVTEKTDNSHGMSRTEVLCARCDGHLGHVFNDGPQPTGLRYCMNSVSMDFVPKEKLAQQEP